MSTLAKDTVLITSYCKKEEREVIRKKAKQAGISFSRFIRRSALGQEVVNKEYPELVKQNIFALAKVNADQSRLGNMLKMWINKGFAGVKVDEIYALFYEIKQTQEKLNIVAEKLLGERN